jgi:cysteine desulfurase
VLLSMGISSAVAQGSVVFTMGEGNDVEDIDYVLGEFPQIIKRLREISPYAQGWGKEEEDKGSCIPKK